MGNDGYASPVVGQSGELVRDRMRSRNYVAGLSGWVLEADGDAEFNDVTIRGDLQSDNYVPGVSGWHLDDGGSAEFYNLTARGNFSTGTTGARVVIPQVPGVGEVDLYSGTAGEIGPSHLRTAVGGTQLEISSGNFGYERAEINLASGPNGATRAQVTMYNDAVVIGNFYVFEDANVAGKLAAENIRSGGATTPGAPGPFPSTSFVDVTFSSAMSATPRVVATPESSNSNVAGWGITNRSSTGFRLHCHRGADTPTSFSYMAMDE